MKEEFKAFVRKKPELIDYVNNGDMTWQRFYEQWTLYGEDDAVWSKYKKQNNEVKDEKTDSFNISSILETVKKIDMNQVQKGVQNLSKAIDILKGFTTKDAAATAATAATAYQPRQLFKKFED